MKLLTVTRTRSAVLLHRKQTNTQAALQQLSKTDFLLFARNSSRSLNKAYKGTLRSALAHLVQLELYFSSLPCIKTQPTTRSARKAAHFAATNPTTPPANDGFWRTRFIVPTLNTQVAV